MSARQKVLGFTSELGLWLLANLVCMGVPAALVYALGVEGHGMFWGKAQTLSYVVATLLLTSTWGSWGTLIWTRSRPLRAVQQAATMLPGVLTVVAGALLAYTGVGRFMIGLGVLGAGIGMLVSAVLLTGGLFTANRLPNWRQIVYGLTIYPVATTVFGGGIAAAWRWFVMGNADQSWRSLFTVATLMVTVLAVSLITTIIPAALSRAARELAAHGCAGGSCDR
jgi:hypothetical protein